MPSSWICVDANLVIRLVADPSDEPVRQLWAQCTCWYTKREAPNREPLERIRACE